MLINLHVKNFALIDDASVDFEDGLNILTGETGAGKSILIDAVSSALGARVGSEVIRKGADSAYVELVFGVSEPDRKEALEALGISTEYDCIVVSRRILPARSIHRINDETVTSAKVRAVTELLLDIHGQHEHQSLLKKSKHLDILDQFAGEACAAAKQKTAASYRRFSAAQKAMEAFDMPEDERLRRADFLRYEIEELQNAAVKPGERDDLAVRYKEMSHFEKIEAALQKVIAAAGDRGAADLIARAQRELGSISSFSDELKNMEDELATAEDLLISLEREASAYLEASAFDESEMISIENRLDQLHRLENKYGSLDDLSLRLEEREAELAHWEHYEDELASAKTELSAAEDELKKDCAVLSKLRKDAAGPLEKAVADALRDLNFLSVDFRIGLKDSASYGPGGHDEAEFLISLNPGEDPQPLGNVASGGELSRIMLAIKTVLADKDEIPSVIFDEIDTGISGRTAQMVGEKLKTIAKSRQVILITHLPQIAALADTHFGIEKEASAGKTCTHIRKLSENESIDELARLLGGLNVTENVYRAAVELKRKPSANK